MTRGIIAAAVAAVAAGLVTAATAQADPTIAAGGTVKPGTQQFGNTLCQDANNVYCPDHQYWKLNATAGDQVTIDWEHSGGDDNYVYLLNVWPEGTDDFSINNADELFHYFIGDNDKAQSVFTIPKTGMYPLEFRSGCMCDGGAGPYDFSTTVEHAVRLFIQKPKAKAKIKRSSKVSVTVRNPDGAPLTGLPVRLTGVWKNKNHKLGIATSAAGVATFQLHLPRSTRKKTIKLRASLSGVGGYLNARSGTIKVKIRR